MIVLENINQSVQLINFIIKFMYFPEQVIWTE